MRRRAATLFVVAAGGAALLFAGAGGDDDGGDSRRYKVELDNAFGMVPGGDVRLAGVNAGRVVDLDLDRKTLKAVIEVEIDGKGFGYLRSDASCETRPQSPLGEYFLDCRPGTSKEELPDGGVVPVERTTSTIPPDLVQNVMRLPYRERFRLILNEFGAGLAGRPEDLNEAIRRGVPALRQTARVLSILADHKQVIARLVTDADRVIGKLADNRRDVGRFVDEAEDTSAASAQRADDIALNFDRLPRFVQELRPTMAALGEAAVEQKPVLEDLSAAAGDLERFLDNSGEFADAARPAIRALGDVAPIGRQAVRAARPNTRQLAEFAEPTTDLAPNLRITLEDFADPENAVERDPRSPGGRGFSGLEAILAYIFNQSLTINGYDSVSHMVRAAIHVDDCAPYMDGEHAKEDPDLAAQCNSWLGPNQPAINQPDPSPPTPPEGPAAEASAGTKSVARRGGSRRRSGARRVRRVAAPAPAPATPAPRSTGGGAPAAPIAPSAIEDILDFLLAP